MLILQAERNVLLKPLQAVTGVVERRHTLPILSNVLIEKTAEKFTMLATDLEIQIIHGSDGEVSGEDFNLTVSAKKLQDILRAIPDGEIVSFDLKEGLLTLKAGKSRFNLQTLPAEDFPQIAVPDEKHNSFSMPQRDLKRLLSQVQYSMAVQDIRYYLNGLLVQTSGHELRLVATDGHRLAYASTGFMAELPENEVILPRKTVIELYKLLLDSDELIATTLLASQIHFEFNDVAIISKVVDGRFPDYNRVIPMDNEKIFLVDRLQLLHALQRAAILANEKFRGVRLVLKPGLMSILCTNSEQEEAEEELEIDYTGEPLEVGFNINYLLDVLNNIPHGTLQLAFGDSNHSALVTIPDNPDFKYVVMPMRI